MYFTSGSDRAFEQLMQTRPGADHFDSGEAGAPEDCGTCRFYRPHWKYQFGQTDTFCLRRAGRQVRQEAFPHWDKRSDFTGP